MPRKQHSHHYIYKTTCTITNRFYIGMHSTSDLEDGYIGSGKRLWYSINKHGRDNHKVEILEFLPNRDSLKKREREIVNEDFLKDPMCMNLTLGGEGGSLPGKNGYKGRKNSNEHKAAMLKGLREKFKDEAFRLEVAEKQKESRILKHGYDPASISMKGKKHTEETKRKLRERDYSYLVGKTNIKKGFIWVNFNGKNKRIEPNLLIEYLDDGWIKGMINTDKMKEHAANRIWITNGIENKKIKNDELAEFLNLGWYNGQTNINRSNRTSMSK